MAQASPRPKKVRIRRALSVREQAELAKSKIQASQKPTKISAARKKLPLTAVVRKIGEIMAVILRPLRPVVRPLRWLVPIYFVNSWHELRHVSWPNRRETWRLTIAVFIFAIVFGSLVAGVDWILDQVFKKVILKQ